jgi:hypothetical protein
VFNREVNRFETLYMTYVYSNKVLTSLVYHCSDVGKLISKYRHTHTNTHTHTYTHTYTHTHRHTHIHVT